MSGGAAAREREAARTRWSRWARRVRPAAWGRSRAAERDSSRTGVPRTGGEPAGGWGAGQLAFYPWLLIAYPPLSDLVEGEVRPVLPAALGLAAFAVLYVSCVRLSFTGRRRGAVVALAGLLGVTFLLLAGPAHDWFFLAPLMTIACGVVLRGRLVYLLLFAVALALVTVMWRAGADRESLSLTSWGTAVGGLVVSIVLRLFSVIGELHDTRRELARVAVAEERLRFSRDLHDLLGHTLSVMVVKAEVVRRLASRDAEAAASQAADIETLGREALHEVRAAVTGYRGHGLAAELDAARAVLADAGVTATVTVTGDAPTSEAGALLGWAVREGVTNVVRHSSARTCSISLRGTVLEIRDDGRGAGGNASGNGLRGLSERAAALGGTLEAGPAPEGGGFLLRVALP